jgi:hypothetical protein
MKKIITFLALAFTITANAQNVGIGETNPTQSKLQVKTTDSAALLIQNTATPIGTKTALFFKSDNNFSGSVATVKDASATYRMGFYTYGGGTASSLEERMTILDGGNVGIGTSNPTASIHVKKGTGLNGTATFEGTNNASHFNYDMAENTYIRGGKPGSHVYINDITGLGSVGIGTFAFSPSYKLQVNGSIYGTSVSAYDPSGNAITGITSANNGVYGSANSGNGISGYSGSGVAGEFNSNTGLAIKTLKGNVEINDGKLVLKDATQGNGRLLESNGFGEASWRENVAFLAKNVGVSNLSIPAGGSGTDVPFITEDYDIGNDFSSTTFTAPITGVYHFDGKITWDQQTFTAGGQLVLFLLVDGGLFTDNIQNASSGNNQSRTSSLSTDVRLSAGSTVKLVAFQNTSNTQQLAAGTVRASFSGHLLFRY